MGLFPGVGRENSGFQRSGLVPLVTPGALTRRERGLGWADDVAERSVRHAAEHARLGQASKQ